MLKAVCEAKLSKSALDQQIGPLSGQSQADSKEVSHSLMEDSEFSFSSSCTEKWVASGEGRGGQCVEPLHLRTRENISDGVKASRNMGNSCHRGTGPRDPAHDTPIHVQLGQQDKVP